jgi:putative SOS response-associated peptidase YedK
MMLWGMPPPKSPWPPVTNIRITTSPHSRAWQAESRCLISANSFAEYAPEPNPETKKKDVVWFAAQRGPICSPLLASRLRSAVIAARSRSRHQVYGFPTTSPYAVVEPILRVPCW